MNTQLMTYSLQGETHAINIYNHPREFTPYTLTLAYKFLLQYYNSLKNKLVPTKIQIETKLLGWFHELLLIEGGDSHSILIDLADIISMHIPTREEEVLNAIRERDTVLQNRLEQRELQRQLHLQRQLPIQQPIKIKKLNTLYTDTQSVHDSTINESMKKAAVQLCKDYHSFGKSYEEHKDIIDDVKQYLQVTYGESEKVNTSMYRICTDNATFNMNLYLHQIFVALWWFIMNHTENRYELEKRLVEELKEMSGMCATGHCSRLINVLQGFSDKYIILISNEQQINAVVSHYLNKKLQACEDTDVVDGMIDGTDVFKNFIKETVQEKWEEWEKEYGHQYLIKQAVNKYAMVSIFV
jgi:hypothetical protein